MHCLIRNSFCAYEYDIGEAMQYTAVQNQSVNQSIYLTQKQQNDNEQEKSLRVGWMEVGLHRRVPKIQKKIKTQQSKTTKFSEVIWS